MCFYSSKFFESPLLTVNFFYTVWGLSQCLFSLFFHFTFQPYFYSLIFLNIVFFSPNFHTSLMLFPLVFSCSAFSSFLFLCQIPTHHIKYNADITSMKPFLPHPQFSLTSLFSGLPKQFVSISVMSYRVTWCPNSVPRSLKARACI